MLFPTTLVGSYPQPEWLIDREKLAGRFPPRVRARELWRIPEPLLAEAQDDATILAIKAQEEAGLDIITDGEIRRESYSNRFATALEGIDIHHPGTALDRSGHPNPVPRIVGPIRRMRPVDVDDLKFLKRHTSRQVKMTVPGPFTMSQQAQNDFYPSPAEAAMDYAVAVNEEIRDLFAAGADIVQVDEPYMQACPQKAEDYGLAALNRALDGVTGTTAVHICFGYAAIIHERPSGYSFLTQLKNCSCRQVSIETAQSKLDCSVLSELGGKKVLLGVIDLSDMNVESPEIVASRIRRALPYVPAKDIIIAPDCGMKYLPRNIAFGKMQAMVEGAKIVRAEVGGSASPPAMLSRRPRAGEAPEETLDPEDWADAQAVAHRAVDDAIAYLRDIRDRPVWQDMPCEVRRRFKTHLPSSPSPLSEVYRETAETLMPYPMGNIHPRFWAWYMGSSNFTGALADFLAAVQGSNVGGGNHAAARMDEQVVDWCKEMIGFPGSASGTLVSGGSMANTIALIVARNVKAGIDVREHGVAAIERPLRFYASDQIHNCHRKAIEAMGLGNCALQRIPTGDDLRLDLDTLRVAIARDRAAGFQPACVIGNAGTVNTGAIDDLRALADLAVQENLWFHVDGCIGALIAIAPDNAHRVRGLERADSVAVDPHKWLHAPFEVGCVLVRDAAAHRASFSVAQEYLEKTPRGLASGGWLYEYGLQTSRGFRALKVWMALKEHGVEKFGRLIDQNIAQAHYLDKLIASEPLLESIARTTINIVCFRYRPPGLDELALKRLNVEIMLRLQEDGVAAISDTTVRGKHCLRVAINNHRTRRSDLDLLVREILLFGRDMGISR